MHPKQMRYLATHPYAAAIGNVPRLIRPHSPLIDVLESITPQDRQRIIGVRLHPDLGYRSTAQFRNAEQLLRWLKPADQMLACESWPAEHCRLKRYSRPLTLADLLAHAASYPDTLKVR